MNNIIDSIRLSGTTYQIQGEVTVDAALDSGSTNPVENKAIYNKFDEVEQVTAAALNNINDRLSEDEEVTAAALNELNDAISGKVDTSTYNTYTAATDTALNGKQATLVSGTNIKTINNESILGSGNIDIQGGGKTIEAGRGITITTGETADTVSFNLPISAGTGTNSIVEGDSTTANGSYSHAEGYESSASGSYSHAEGVSTYAKGSYSHAEGNSTKASGSSSHAEGLRTIANNQSEHTSGQYNVSSKASTTFGDSGNTLFSVGNGTSNSARHNAFEIRQNGDIYLTKDGQDVKLQDQLGGSSITVDTALDSGSTNPVQNQALYDELRIPKNEEVETILQWENYDEGITTNYPSGASKLEFYVDESQMTENGYAFWKTDWEELGNISIVVSNGNISVTSYENVTYSISGNVVTVEYPTIAAEVTKIHSNYDQFWTVKAYTDSIVYEPLIDQVSANTSVLNDLVPRIAEDEEVTAAALNELNDNFGGLKLVKLTEAEYNNLQTKDPSTLYVIVD